MRIVLFAFAVFAPGWLAGHMGLGAAVASARRAPGRGPWPAQGRIAPLPKPSEEARMHVHGSYCVLILATALLVAGCGGESSTTGAGPTQAEATPAATIKGMVALAEAGKWEAYVSTYYGEQHKMDKPETQIAEVAARLKKAGPTLVEMLKACLEQTPTLSEDGTRAVYPNQVTLYKKDGTWGFHL